MKRIHLFEFEDFPWFPNWLRVCLTRYIVTIHKLMGSKKELAKLLVRALPHASRPHIVDLCSGSGGPMLDVLEEMKTVHGVEEVAVTFSDLYPNLSAADQIDQLGDASISYRRDPVDATQVDPDLQGVRTMVCSLHHMRPELARKILADAQQAQQPFCAFEISDNSLPKWMMYVGLPINFLMVLFLTPFVRPMSWQQLVFTYLIPLLPIFIAWDGAVSNVRTYTLDDLDELLAGMESADYRWEKGALPGKPKKLYALTPKFRTKV